MVVTVWHMEIIGLELIHSVAGTENVSPLFFLLFVEMDRLENQKKGVFKNNNNNFN